MMNIFFFRIILNMKDSYWKIYWKNNVLCYSSDNISMYFVLWVMNSICLFLILITFFLQSLPFFTDCFTTFFIFCASPALLFKWTNFYVKNKHNIRMLYWRNKGKFQLRIKIIHPITISERKILLWLDRFIL